MKYLKYFESNIDIDSICRKYDIKNYTINPDGTVDVDSYVNLYNKGLDKLPLKFGYVSGDFDCSRNQLTSLEGAPSWVGGGFGCGNNQLTSLEGGPKKVDGSFFCSENQLTTLEGSPEEVGSFYCQNNKLTSLVGAPREVGEIFYCGRNPLPEEILDNMDYINKIVKYQNDYNIWRRDGTLDKYRFSDMMKEILEETNEGYFGDYPLKSGFLSPEVYNPHVPNNIFDRFITGKILGKTKLDGKYFISLQVEDGIREIEVEQKDFFNHKVGDEIKVKETN